MNRSPALPTATELALWRQREEELDRSGMRALVTGFGERLSAAIPRARAFASGLTADPPPAAIAVLGMGGSAVSGAPTAVSVKAPSHPLVFARGGTRLMSTGTT